jgi:hypothetical protein
MRYPAGISGEEYAAMEEGYEQGVAEGRAERARVRAERDDLRHQLAKAEGSRDMLLASSRLREEQAEERLAEGIREALTSVIAYCRTSEGFAEAGISGEAIGLARAYKDVADRLEERLAREERG